MTRTRNPVPVRERVLAKASELFYTQGYRATGINQIIAESGVAKASFYDHFPSKLDLAVAYAQRLSEVEFGEVREAIMANPTAEARFFAIFGVLRAWLSETRYRGCPFQNLVSEIGCSEPRVRAVVAAHRDRERALFRELTAAYAQQAPGLAGIDVETVATAYHTLVEGAVSLSSVYQAAWPIDEAERGIRALLPGVRTEYA